MDSLAQSRESEYGIHEVSKRILSILLQRLEGFHGKSNSIMICTTNRKVDLDKALLSRFDLMISYQLPDEDTRKAIFQRYAKHLASLKPSSVASSSAFSGFFGSSTSSSQKETNANVVPDENFYEALAKASNGLSCRDIKEACEQAERICASRIVQKHVINGEKNGAKWDKQTIPLDWLPNLNDYLQTIETKQLEHRSTTAARQQPYSSI